MSLGKIKDIYVGRGGYQDAMFGVTIHLETCDGSCVDFWGTWSDDKGQEEYWKAKQVELFGQTMMRLKNLMETAKVWDIAKLKGIPVDVVFSDKRLSSWRILTEVL